MKLPRRVISSVACNGCLQIAEKQCLKNRSSLRESGLLTWLFLKTLEMAKLNKESIKIAKKAPIIAFV